MTTISETLRLELKPLGVDVVTVITGAVKTNIFNNKPENHHLPENSLYSSIEKDISRRVEGQDVTNLLGSSEQFARDLARGVLNGNTGRLSCGKMSTLIPLVTTYLPTWIVVRHL